MLVAEDFTNYSVAIHQLPHVVGISPRPDGQMPWLMAPDVWGYVWSTNDRKEWSLMLEIGVAILMGGVRPHSRATTVRVS